MEPEAVVLEVMKDGQPDTLSSVPEKTLAESVAARQGKRTKRCLGREWDAETLRLLGFSISFLLLLSLGGMVFNLLEYDETKETIQAALTAQQDASLEVLSLLNNNQTLYDLLVERDLALTAFTEIDTVNPWRYGSAFIFSFTVVTTIGYGTFAPATLGGQMFLVFYSLLGIPVAGMTLVYLADRALKFFSYLFSTGRAFVGQGHDNVQQAFDEFDSDASGELDLAEFRSAVLSLGIELTDLQFATLVTDIDEDGSGVIDCAEFSAAVEFLNADVSEAAARKNRIYIITICVVLWVSLGMLVFSLSEGWHPQQAFYFAFVTLTTVGLGDLFPGSTGGIVFLIFFAAVGLGMIATLLTLIEGLLKDWKKNAKVMREKARQQAMKQKERMEKLRKDAASKFSAGIGNVNMGERMSSASSSMSGLFKKAGHSFKSRADSLGSDIKSKAGSVVNILNIRKGSQSSPEDGNDATAATAAATSERKPRSGWGKLKNQGGVKSVLQMKATQNKNTAATTTTTTTTTTRQPTTERKEKAKGDTTTTKEGEEEEEEEEEEQQQHQSEATVATPTTTVAAEEQNSSDSSDSAEARTGATGEL